MQVQPMLKGFAHALPILGMLGGVDLIQPPLLFTFFNLSLILLSHASQSLTSSVHPSSRYYSYEVGRRRRERFVPPRQLYAEGKITGEDTSSSGQQRAFANVAGCNSMFKDGRAGLDEVGILIVALGF